MIDDGFKLEFGQQPKLLRGVENNAIVQHFGVALNGHVRKPAWMITGCILAESQRWGILDFCRRSCPTVCHGSSDTCE